MRFDKTKFWQEYKNEFQHNPTQLELNGTETLLDLLSNDTQITELKWAAYILATIRNECGANMQPIKEKKAPLGSMVWNKYQSKYWNTGFYGRGYSQLTLKGNYQQFSKLLYNDNRLINNPDLVLNPEVGYKILSTGMVRGLFRKRFLGAAYKLSDFFNESIENPIDARQIVNGMKGEARKWALRTAGYYEQYKKCLEFSRLI